MDVKFNVENFAGRIVQKCEFGLFVPFVSADVKSSRLFCFIFVRLLFIVFRRRLGNTLFVPYSKHAFFVSLLLKLRRLDLAELRPARKNGLKMAFGD